MEKHQLWECPTGPLPNMAKPAMPDQTPHSAHGPGMLLLRVEWLSYKYYQKEEHQAGREEQEFIWAQNWARDNAELLLEMLREGCTLPNCWLVAAGLSGSDSIQRWGEGVAVPSRCRRPVKLSLVRTALLLRARRLLCLPEPVCHLSCLKPTLIL